MTQQEITKGNKTIASFMKLEPFQDSKYGLLYTDPTSNKTVFGDGGLRYHESWDWLKPVVDKIFEYGTAHRTKANKVIRLSIVVMIMPCWEECVKFINWLNTHQQTQIV